MDGVDKYMVRKYEKEIEYLRIAQDYAHGNLYDHYLSDRAYNFWHAVISLCEVKIYHREMAIETYSMGPDDVF